MLILLTGATGFVGSTLLPRLLADGHEVRAFARDPSRVSGGAVEVFRGDLLTGEGLAAALDGVDVAYYLVHSMERRSVSVARIARPDGKHATGGAGAPARAAEPTAAGEAAAATPHPRLAANAPFERREREAALRFAEAASGADVTRIVYLGGPVPQEASTHLQSRLGVEQILLDAVPASVALRASILIGARSRSFRLLVRLVERLPVLALPAWRSNRTAPLDARDVTEMLLAAGSEPSVAGARLDAAGPEVLTYEEVIARIAEAMLVSRPRVRLGVNATPIAARVVAAIVKEDPDLVVPLMESLAGDLLPRGRDAASALAVALHGFDAAVEHALREWELTEPLAAR